MKHLLSTCAALAVVGLAGCKEGTSTAPSTNTNRPESARKLTVKSPGSQTLTQDQTDDMTISISRDHFSGPVDIHLKDLPQGVSVVTKEMTIPEGKDSVKVTVKADPGAPATSDHQVIVQAKPQGQPDMQEATVDFKLTVKAKK
jgi:outer membrane receptor for ferric coprogen and ferric-rhodotorulic acid